MLGSVWRGLGGGQFFASEESCWERAWAGVWAAITADAIATAAVAIAMVRLRNFLAAGLGVSIFVLDSKLRSLDRTPRRRKLAGGVRVPRKVAGGEDDLWGGGRKRCTSLRSNED